jgi:phospholipase/carboxylesterase
LEVRAVAEVLARALAVARARRRLLITVAALAVGAALIRGGVSAWRNRPDRSVPEAPHHAAGRLWARPRPPTTTAPTPGVWPLGIGERRDGALYVPATLPRDRPVSVLVWLHGHGGRGERSIEQLKVDADRAGLLVVAPTARRTTWDLVGKTAHFDGDVAFIDAALAFVFDRFVVDRQRIFLAGHSDGATYALALGLTNGDLFARVVAFAPERLIAGGRVGKPPVVVVHGRADPVHRIETTSRRVVPELRAAGYAVDYEELDGGHELPPDALRRVLSSL